MAVDSIRWLTLADADRERLRAALARALQSRPWVQAAWLYGSAARGGPARDIDIGLLADPLAQNGDLTGIAGQVAADLGLRPSDLDVRVLNGGDPVFLGNVLREGERLFERDRERRVRFEVWAMNQWLDFQPIWERLRKRVLARWSRG